MSKICLFSKTGGWCRCCSRRRMRVNPRRLPRGGFSRVELAAHMWTPRRVGGLETTSIEGCGWAFLVLEAAAVFVCVLEKTQSGYVTEPHGLTASLPSIGFCSAKAGSSREPLGARAQQAPPRQPNPASTRLRYYLLAASRRLVRGRQSWGNSAGFCSGLAALAVVLLLGLLVAASGDAKIERLRAIYKTSATPSSGLVETPSGGCGKDGFLRLSLQKQLCGGSPSCGVVGSLPASYGWVCSVLQGELSARPQNTAICNEVSPSLFQAFGYAPRLRRFSRPRRRLAASSRIYTWRRSAPSIALRALRIALVGGVVELCRVHMALGAPLFSSSAVDRGGAEEQPAVRCWRIALKFLNQRRVGHGDSADKRFT